MTGDMRDILERELRLHAAALRGLARDLVGAGDADDVVQETALQALRTPPARGGALGGWLAGIVRHVASRHRRTAARRVRREQTVAREPVAGEPAAGADEGDTLRFLTDAVLALPQPYRAAVFARYLKDLEPAAIAAQSGEPLATVKTRLKRGLTLLRERFDAREQERGGDWRGALAGAFGIERVAVVTGVAGVFAMTAAMKWTFGGAAAAIAVASLALFSDAAPWSTASPPPQTRERPEVAVAAAPQDARNEPEAGSLAARDAVASASPSNGQFTIRGRCVDEDGSPLVALPVKLHGSKVEGGLGKDFEREYGEWLAAGGRERWRDQALVTSTDGRFQFRGEPSPLSLSLLFTRNASAASTRATHSVSCWQIDEAEDVDVGDLVIPIRCTLRCRVVDDRGRVVPPPRIQVIEDSSARNAANERWTVTSDPSPVRATSDGAVSSMVVAGRYQCIVAHRQTIRGQFVDVPARAATWEHEIVVASAPTDETIRGVVVDERGTPIADVDVFASREVHSAACTDLAGRFTLQRGAQPDGEVEVHASKDGFDARGAQPKVRWGTDDVRLVMHDVVAVDVRVVDDATGEPVTDYAVWTRGAPDDPETRKYGQGFPRVSGRHEHGVARVAGLARGRHLVVVEPHRRDLWRSDAVPFEAAATHVNTVDVRVRRAAQRAVVVRTADGKPVRRAGIDVIDASAAAPDPVTPGLRTQPLDRWDPEEVPAARVLLQQATTDAAGTATLRGPAGGRVVLRVAVDGVAPFCAGPLSLDDPEPFAVTVPVGARLVARIGPPELVRMLRDLQERSSRAPGFRLRRGPEREVELVPPKTNQGLRLDQDGTLVIDGVPPGDWHLALEPWELGDRGESASLVWHPVSIAAVTLRDGETTETSVDLTSWLPGTISGPVRCNGTVVANAQIGVEVQRVHFETGKPGRWLMWAKTDADGRFRYTGRAGSLTVLVERSGADPHSGRTNWVAAATTVELPANGTIERDFDVVSCPVCVRLLAPDGTPVARTDVVLTTTGTGDWPRHPIGATDADGRVAGETGPGTFSVQVGAERKAIATVTVVPGAANEFELRVR